MPQNISTRQLAQPILGLAEHAADLAMVNERMKAGHVDPIELNTLLAMVNQLRLVSETLSRTCEILCTHATNSVGKDKIHLVQ